VSLQETHNDRSHRAKLKSLVGLLLSNPHILGFAILVAAVNGIYFRYFAEGSFYLINLLGLSPSAYDVSFIGLAFAGSLGGWISKRLHNTLTSLEILWRGIILILIGTTFFLIISLSLIFIQAPPLFSVIATVSIMMFISLSITMIAPNCLSLALEDYQHAVGATSSLFGFFYYALTSFCTLGIGFLHNGTLYPMSLYFFGIGVFSFIVFIKMIDHGKKTLFGF